MEKEKQAHFDIHTPSPSHSEEGPTFEDEDFESYMNKLDTLLLNLNCEIIFNLLIEDQKEQIKLLMALMAIKFKISYHLTIDVVEEILKVINSLKSKSSSLQVPDQNRRLNNVFMIKSADEEKELPFSLSEKKFLPNTEEFMVMVFQLSSISTIKFPNYFANMYSIIEATNSTIAAFEEKNSISLFEILEYLQQPLSHASYCYGSVIRKEAHTFLIKSSDAMIQVGIPPETIKQSIRKGESVPQIFVLPPSLWIADINFGEVEFPIYFNYFIKQAFLYPTNKIQLIGESSHLDRVKMVFKESFHGPDSQFLFFDEEIVESKKVGSYKYDFKVEQNVIAKNPEGEITPISELANFIPFVSGVATIKTNQSQVKIINRHGLMQFFENETHFASIDTGVSLHSHKCLAPIFDKTSVPFFPPTFGITFLGTSHGFDAKGNTTGFIIWINGRGLIIDPPANAIDYIRSNGIPLSHINKIILTHCHSDHDSGALRLLIGGTKMELYTTKTIHSSYLRKMKAITDINIEQCYNFVPVLIGTQIKILGASFLFDYSFHTIPTIRFKVQFGGKTLSYSSDTHYNPELYSKLRDEGIISPERETDLRLFLFDADVIIHEAGVPPIHTAIETLNDLPTSLKKKMLIVHCASIPSHIEKTLPNGKKFSVPVKDLKIPKSGFENTLVFDVGEFMEGYCAANRRLHLLADVFFFRSIPPPVLYELHSVFHQEIFVEGEVIISHGDVANSFFVIESGLVDIYEGKNIHKDYLKATLSVGDIFGENALRTGRQISRTATVVARTGCTLFKIDSTTFKYILSRTRKTNNSIEVDIARMARMRPFVQKVLAKTYLFQNLSPDQINFVACILEKQHVFQTDEVIIHEGDLSRSLFILESGSVRVERLQEDGTPRELMRYGAGEIFGELSLITGLPRTASVIANEESVILELTQEGFEKMMNTYQNLRLKLAILVEQRLKETFKIQKQISPPSNSLSASKATHSLSSFDDFY